jgi:hypothetical protein
MRSKAVAQVASQAALVAGWREQLDIIMKVVEISNLVISLAAPGKAVGLSAVAATRALITLGAVDAVSFKLADELKSTLENSP